MTAACTAPACRRPLPPPRTSPTRLTTATRTRTTASSWSRNAAAQVRTCGRGQRLGSAAAAVWPAAGRPRRRRELPLSRRRLQIPQPLETLTSSPRLPARPPDVEEDEQQLIRQLQSLQSSFENAALGDQSGRWGARSAPHIATPRATCAALPLRTAAACCRRAQPTLPVPQRTLVQAPPRASWAPATRAKWAASSRLAIAAPRAPAAAARPALPATSAASGCLGHHPTWPPPCLCTAAAAWPCLSGAAGAAASRPLPTRPRPASWCAAGRGGVGLAATLAGWVRSAAVCT